MTHRLAPDAEKDPVVPSPSLCPCVILGKSPTLSVPQCPPA